MGYIRKYEATEHVMNQTPPKQPERKKFFHMLQSVKDFVSGQTDDVKQELNDIIWKLEIDGVLSMPYGEKVTNEDNLFAIRVIHAGNVRVFYAYGLNNMVYGLHGYVKKTEEIPVHERRHAIKVLKQLRQGGLVK